MVTIRELWKRFTGLFSRSDVGTLGENIAADWLRRTHGYAIVARNWRSPKDRRDELDLICLDGEILVFVEIKARSAGALVPGYYAVDQRKKRVVRRACDAYLRHLRPAPKTFRFDIVEVTINASPAAPDVRHFENVPIFPKQYRR